MNHDDGDGFVLISNFSVSCMTVNLEYQLRPLYQQLSWRRRLMVLLIFIHFHLGCLFVGRWGISFLVYVSILAIVLGLIIKFYIFEQVEKQCAHFYSVTITEEEARDGFVCRVQSSDKSKFKVRIIIDLWHKSFVI